MKILEAIRIGGREIRVIKNFYFWGLKVAHGIYSTSKMFVEDLFCSMFTTNIDLDKPYNIRQDHLANEKRINNICYIDSGPIILFYSVSGRNKECRLNFNIKKTK